MPDTRRNPAPVVRRKTVLSPEQAQALETIQAEAANLHEIEQRLDSAVRDAVHLGTPWREIGAALGVTAQAAHKRYSSKGGRRGS